MNYVRRMAAAWATSLALISPATAQLRSGPIDTSPAGPPIDREARLMPSFDGFSGDFRNAGLPRRSGLIAAFQVDEDIHVGIGRFRVAEPPKPRTNMEAERAPTDLRRRERGVAAIGMSLRF